MFQGKNMLDQRFQRTVDVEWRVCEDGLVELTQQHRGFFAAIAHGVFKRPEASYIKLDALGSCVWLALGEYDAIADIAPVVQEQFGDEANPLLPRLAQFMTILRDNGFIELKPEKS